ncbi:hypothetical protein SAMN02745121_03778 [Nannocystis exedens]|uniref:Leucine Rich repeat-containing protein n=1 Tax=Nannocystis exedens TaxID=54 RepID=A0A1I1ZE06_9BACT|nr:hypothetical protein [Nannocystis exedens]PCC75016.1 hypothetical protein NAEX_08119 [Nannocystis exedens]SFE29966.1 hypothetical protein SAMN02745121_03778 [Nannocystis exedens]
MSKFLAHAELLAGSPGIRFIDISVWSAQLAPGDWQRLTACPLLEWVTMLGVRGRYAYDGADELLGEDEAAALAVSPHTRRLLHLDFGAQRDRRPRAGGAGERAGARGADRARAPLRPVRRRGLAALATGKLSRLESIELSFCDGKPSAAGWGALLTADWPNLRELWLVGNSLAPALQTALQARWGARVRLSDDRG